MKEVVKNKYNLKEKDINDRVYRARALIINSNGEILLAFCKNSYQFPGGYLEGNETISDCLKREVLEETGIKIEEKEYIPFYIIKYYNPNHPKKGINRYTELNYFIILTNQKYNLDMMNLDDSEKENNFELKYVELKDFEIILKDTLKNNNKNKIVYPEMIEILKEYNNL